MENLRVIWLKVMQIFRMVDIIKRNLEVPFDLYSLIECNGILPNEIIIIF